MMILFVGSNLYLSRINSQQLEATMYMNQYRLGSKTLTAAVQPYAVTGDKTYYNNMKELHEDKNCDIAWESLQQDGLTDNEREEINHIAEISDILRAYRRICRWLVQIKDSMVNILADNESLWNGISFLFHLSTLHFLKASLISEMPHFPLFHNILGRFCTLFQQFSSIFCTFSISLENSEH